MSKGRKYEEIKERYSLDTKTKETMMPKSTFREIQIAKTNKSGIKCRKYRT